MTYTREYVHCKDCNSPGYPNSEGWYHVTIDRVSYRGSHIERYILCIQCGEDRGYAR